MVDEMMMRAEDGSLLTLLGILPGSVFFESDGYVAMRSKRKGTVYTVPRGAKVVRIETLVDIQEGACFFPGDPTAFTQLDERPLFKILGVVDGNEEDEGR